MENEQRQWKYYNHAMIPACAPHITPDLLSVKNKTIWTQEKGKKPLLVRWTTDFDCSFPTEWWYVIKDTPFDLMAMKSKRRYEINKGNKFFEVKEIDAGQYKEKIFEVMEAAFSAYPPKYRPVLTEERIYTEIESWKDKYRTLGAFSKEFGELCGYALITEEKEYAELNVVKTMPAFEKYAVNAAIGYKIVTLYQEKLEQGYYLCNGSRNVSHETAYADYLEKYFDFRKVYCHLHICYRWYVRLVVYVLYPLRKYLKKADHIAILHNVNALLAMEEFKRKS